MTLRETIIADLESIATDLENPVMTWNSEEYEVVPSSTGKQLNLEEGGFGSDLDLVINVRKELFTDEVYPASQQTITYNSIEYRIESVRYDVTGAFLRIFCINKNRGV